MTKDHRECCPDPATPLSAVFTNATRLYIAAGGNVASPGYKTWERNMNTKIRQLDEFFKSQWEDLWFTLDEEASRHLSLERKIEMLQAQFIALETLVMREIYHKKQWFFKEPLVMEELMATWSEAEEEYFADHGRIWDVKRCAAAMAESWFNLAIQNVEDMRDPFYEDILREAGEQ
eukprot:c14852_g1_i1.p1 GENE.c14852_g1_i1~~c14852_g1_i1.p1  ORF type:complete len:176 (-),score=40.68 c14852_g1_i1:104-631(-)